jgi:hypothetical protein
MECAGRLASKNQRRKGLSTKDPSLAPRRRRIISEANHSMNFAKLSAFARIVGPVGMLALFAGSAQAEPAGAAKNSHCTNRGADFVAVAGSDNCVRLGGRVRVNLGANANVSAYTGATADGVQPAAARSHVRTDPISSFIDLFPH